MSARKRTIKAKRLTIPGFLKRLRKHKSARWFLQDDWPYRRRREAAMVAWWLLFVAFMGA